MTTFRWFTSLNFAPRTLLNKDPSQAMHNSQFFRPLYAIAAVGPICLLDAEQISSKSKGGWSTVHLTQASVLGLKHTCMEKMAIEADLLHLLLDAAMEGPQIIHSRLDKLVLKWSESLSLIDPSPDNCPSKSISASLNEETSSIKGGTQKKFDHQRAMRQALQRALSKPVHPNALSDAVKKELEDVMELFPTSELGQPLSEGRDRSVGSLGPKTDWVASYGSKPVPATGTAEYKSVRDIFSPISANLTTPQTSSLSVQESHVHSDIKYASDPLSDTTLPSSSPQSHQDNDSDKKRKRIEQSTASEDELQTPSKKEKVVGKKYQVSFVSATFL